MFTWLMGCCLLGFTLSALEMLILFVTWPFTAVLGIGVYLGAKSAEEKVEGES